MSDCVFRIPENEYRHCELCSVMYCENNKNEKLQTSMGTDKTLRCEAAEKYAKESRKAMLANLAGKILCAMVSNPSIVDDMAKQSKTPKDFANDLYDGSIGLAIAFTKRLEKAFETMEGKND